MGLLGNLFDFEDPQNAMRSGLALGLLTGRGRNSGEIFGNALGQGLQLRNAASDMAMRKQQFERQKLLDDSIIAERNERVAKEKKQAENDQALREYAKRFYQPESAGTDLLQQTLPEQYRVPPIPSKPARFDTQGFMAGLPSVPGIDPFQALKLQKEFSPQEEFNAEPRYDQQGNAYLVSKSGNIRRLDGIKQRDKLIETNLGGQVGFRTEYSPQVSNMLNKSASPDSVLSAQTSMRGQNMTDARARDANNIAKQLGITEKELKIEDMMAKREDRMRSKEGAKASVLSQISVIDKALNHPGRETATGLSGSLNPTNYIPGTDATDFRSVLDQIGGTAFLQAFESLKGGGAITEVEGKKATDAIARLNRAQSDAEFKKSLQDLRSVMTAGAQRLGAQPATQSPQDAQALQWANANPNDPRSAQIKQRLGVR